MKFPKEKVDKLLEYSQGIALVYYIKHKHTYEHDSVSLDDLQQEANIICLKMIKKYGKLDGKNSFDIKKFVSRAVGWRMRDMLKGAIVNIRKYQRNDITNTQENGDLIQINKSYQKVESGLPEEFFDLLSPNIKYGFSIKEIYSHFSKNDLKILKGIVENRSTKEMLLSTGLKNKRMLNRLWNNKIRPKLRKLLKNVLFEYADGAI